MRLFDLARHVRGRAVELAQAAGDPRRADAHDRVHEAQRLQQRSAQVPAQAGDGRAAAQMPQGALERGRSRLVAAGDVFHRALDRRHLLGAEVLAHRGIEPAQDLVGVDQPLVPRQVVDHLVRALVDAVEGQQQGPVHHTIGATLGVAAARGGRGVGGAHHLLGALGVGMRRSLARLHRIVLDRVVAAAHLHRAAVGRLDREGRRLDPFRLLAGDALFLLGDLRPVALEEIPHALHKLPLGRGERLQHRHDALGRPAAPIQQALAVALVAPVERDRQALATVQAAPQAGEVLALAAHLAALGQ